ncbi:4'-phosphopantetheinyl transferase family protein [Cellulomonas fengjieae]|uniref:4'-phosphopantetheinyl transferase family protein n=1 Tax=Cellulomonas fengjieae TaxID=2819978 RepID=UPI001AAF8E37|nr:4'-phosphopantetheinyl transferase superfamily protein [Cellulomonas fengjieae]MBO3103272.1 4'-phosphopantetheinyl transferase superfamily protein [Cellulomonas fengjieae]
MDHATLPVTVHWARTVPVGALADVLTRGERDRAAAVQNEESRDAVASSLVLARTAVGSWAGLDAGAVELHRHCPRCGSRAHGRPSASWRTVPDDVRRTPTPHLSLARTTGLVVVATTRAGAVGIDVERRADRVFDGFDDVVLAGTEARPVDDEARLRTWTRKEALLKAAGRGLDADPRRLVLGPGDEPPRIEEAPADALGGPWHLQDLDPVEEVLGALALRAHGPVSVRVTRVQLAGRR